MKEFSEKSYCGGARRMLIRVAMVAGILVSPLHAEQISLQAIVTPSTTILKDGHPVTFALHGFIDRQQRQEGFGVQERGGGCHDAVSSQAVIGCGERTGARLADDAAISRAAASVVMVRCASAGFSAG